MRIPSTPYSLMSNVYRRIFPSVNNQLDYWEKRAKQIPNQELRNQALASIQSKRFHCQGGGVFAILAGEAWGTAIEFIVAYQTISDYLDNLCDRSTSMDPNDFRLLHEAMSDALTPNGFTRNYYELRKDQEDEGYLIELVQTCQKIIQQMDNYSLFKDELFELQRKYIDLQVHKHVVEEERVPRLTKWYEENNNHDLSWYEFAAASGSTLGIFCLISYAIGNKISEPLSQQIYAGYFPYVQGLHILLDYFIDQQEDQEEGDLNFCFYYPNEEQMVQRFMIFIQSSTESVKELPNRVFHQMISQGLVGLYLADKKVKELPNGRAIKKQLLRKSGYYARFFYWNLSIYNRLKR